MKRDFYQVLGLSKGADNKEIKKAYHKLAKKYHPDMNQGNADAELKFKEITEAYEVLSDPEKKKLYDQYGMAAFENGFSQTSQNSEGSFGQENHFYQKGPFREYHYSSTGGQDMDDILNEFFKGHFQNAQGSFHSDNFEPSYADLNISLYESAFGADKTLQADHFSSPLRVHIPAGIGDGQTLRLKGKGNVGPNGIQSDLMLKIHILPDSCYERKGNDLYTSSQIPYATAVLGGKVKMHTLYGSVECNIPAGTQSGSKIRLKNKGIVSMKNKNQYGDEYVTIQIQVPKSISQEEKNLIEQLALIQKRRTQQAYSA